MEVKRKMAKNSKSKLLFTAIILAGLLICNAYAALMPNAHAAEVTVQQEGLSVTDEVIGVDLTKYATASEDYRQDLYLDVIPQENVRYTLETDGGKLDFYYSFVNEKLQKIHVLEVQGTPQMQKAISANPLDLSRDFLSAYQDYTENALYGELRSMLNTIEANKNATQIYGNTKLVATVQDNSATFRWTYTFNGIEAPDKCVALHYENGFMSYFIDNWDLYKIANTNVNLSEQQTIDIAMTEAKNFTWATVSDNETLIGLKYNVTNAMVWKTVFANSLCMDNPRDQDPLMLYPMRHIWVSFDKFYPCNVYGMNVYVWADTGEIGHLQERFSTVDPPADLVATAEDIAALASVGQESEGQIDVTESNSLSVSWIMLPAFAIPALGTVIVYLGKKKTFPLSLGLPKRRSSRIGGVLLCLLIASTMLIATVNASSYHGGITVWGSESSDAWDSEHELSWRKHPDEVDQQQDTSQTITTLFLNNGYTGSNEQGLGSYKDDILNRIGIDQANYERVAVVDFDHGNGLANVSESIPEDEFHFMFEDQRGTMEGADYHVIPPGGSPDNPGYAVYDYEIYDETDLENHFFVLINTCNSAYIDDTFGIDPVYNSSQGKVNGRARGMPYAWSHGTMVYPYGTPNPLPGYMSGDGYTVPDTGDFCYMGFYYGSAALTQDVDGKSGNPHPYWWWLEEFFEDALTNNWSVKQALNEASQDIYLGNFGEIPLHINYTSIWPMYRGDPPSWHYEAGVEIGTGRLLVYGNSNIKLYQPELTLRARDDYDNPIYPVYKIDGTTVYTGVNVISGTHTFEVEDLLGYTFDHITVDDGSNPYNVSTQTTQLSFTSDCVITAYFDYDFPTHQLEILAINQYSQPGIVPLYIDDHYVGTTGDIYTVSEGEHEIYVLSPINHGGGSYSVFVAYYYDEDYHYDNPMTLTVTEGKTIYACYWTY